MTDKRNAILDAVGPRLRAIRKERGSTLEQLAELTGMSVSTLSRIESGRRRATLEVLLPLAQAYRTPLDELVGAPTTGDPRIHPRPVSRDGVVWVPSPVTRAVSTRSSRSCRCQRRSPSGSTSGARGLRVALRPHRQAVARSR